MKVIDVAQIPSHCGCGVLGSCSSDLTLAWELPYAVGVALKSKTNKQTKILFGKELFPFKPDNIRNKKSNIASDIKILLFSCQ